jgi:Phage integrase family
LGAAEPRYVLQSPGLVENCVGLYVPLLEFNLLPPLASETLHGHNRQQGPQVFTGLDLSTDRQQARRKLDLRRPKRERKLPQLLAEVDLKRFFRVIQDCGDVEHEIMLKFLFFTAVRVSELVKIKVGEVYLGSCKVFIGQGKGAKDRYILFQPAFGDIEESLAGKSQKPIPVRNKPLWTIYSSADPADRTELPGAGGAHSTGTSPSIPPSDDYVPHLTRSIGCTDPTDLRP